MKYKRIDLEALVASAPNILEAEYLAEGKACYDFRVIEVLRCEPDGFSVSSGMKISVYSAGTYEWAVSQKKAQAEPWVWEYKPKRPLILKQTYLLFLTRAREEGVYDLFADGAHLPLSESSRARDLLASHSS